MTLVLGLHTRDREAGFTAGNVRLEVVGVSLTAPVAELLTLLSQSVVVITGDIF